jgi:hypothetical protein
MLHLDGYAYDNLSPFERSAGSVRSTPAMRPLFGLDKIPGEVGVFSRLSGCDNDRGLPAFRIN